MRVLKNYFLVLFSSVASVNATSQTDTLKQLVVDANATITPSASYKVIKIDNIAAHETENLADILSKETPIYIKSHGPGSLSTISIRGAGASHTQLYWNGIAINPPTLGQLDLSTLPAAFIDNAEIHLGASSVVDGSGGLGGAIQLNTSANFNNKLNTNFKKEIGSFGIDRTYFSFNVGSKKFQSKTSLFKNATSNDFKYIDITQENRPILKRENAEILQHGIKQEFYLTPNKTNYFTIKSNYINSYRQIPSALGISPKGEFQTDEILRLFGEWRHIKKKNVQHFRLALLKDKLNYVDSIVAINSLINIDSYRASYNFKRYFNHLFKMSAQINIDKDIANSTGFSSQEQRNRQSGFVQVEQKSKHGHQYTLAIRQEIINGKLTPIVPTIGMKYFLSKNHRCTINANAARNHKAPSLNELYWDPGGNRELLSEIGFTTEIGLMYKYEKISFNISPYYSLIDNWIQWLPQENGIWSPINVRQVENKGVEIAANKIFSILNKGKLHINAGYNYVRSINKSSVLTNDNSFGKQLIYVPLQSLNIVAKLEIKKWLFGYNQTITGKVFIDATNTTYMPYYAPADVNISYSFIKNNKSAVIGFKVANLYDEDYQIMANRPMPGRWFLLFLKVNLNSKDD